MATRIPTMYGRYYVISFIWRGRQMTFTAYRASLSKMQRPQAQKLCDKMYPGCRVISFHESDATDGPVVLTTEEAPKGAKYDRMVKHIKKSYSKDGNLTKGEEGIAYATAWKHKNKKKNEEVQLEAKKCGKGEYFCNDEQKCKPIPKGHHVMPDGMLMKGETHNETYFYAGETPSVHKDKDQKKKENEKKVKKEDTVVITKAADEKKKKKKEKGVQGATDVPNFPQDQVSEEAWQRKEGKNKSGGLNEKGRKSYERANPGSDLKAPSKKKGNKRRASFCARMKGMKKKLTSAKTARDPDSRINKSLRAWNC